MRKLVMTLVVLAVLLVLGDRAAALGAERVAGSELRAANGLDQAPVVHIGGFPFVTQFASGRYARISATAGNLRVGSSSASVRLSRVRVDFQNVTATRDYRQFRAKRASAHARIGYADLSEALGITVRYDGTDRIRATKTFAVLGERLSPTISVRPVVVDHTLEFADLRIMGLADVPRKVSSTFASIFGVDFALDELPFDIKLISLEVDRDGVQLRLSGRNLRYVAPR